MAKGGEIMKLEARAQGEEYNAPPPMHSKDIERLAQLQENLYEMLRDVHGDEVIADMKRHDPVEAWKLEQAYQSGARSRSWRAAGWVRVRKYWLAAQPHRVYQQ